MVDESRILRAIGETRTEVSAFRTEAILREGDRLKREGIIEEKLDTVVLNVERLGNRLEKVEDIQADHTARFRFIKWLATGTLAAGTLLIAAAAGFSNLFKNLWGSP